jgi:hypothetical protein
LLKILRPPIGDGKEGMLYAVAISPDGTAVAVGGFTGVPESGNYPIYIFDRESGAIRRTVSRIPYVVHRLAYTKDGRYLAAALGGRNGMRIFETAGYTEVARAAGISHYSDNSLSEGVKFAADDAELVAARLKEQEGKGLYRKVNFVSLRDSKATIKNIESEVAQAAKSVQLRRYVRFIPGRPWIGSR